MYSIQLIPRLGTTCVAFSRTPRSWAMRAPAWVRSGARSSASRTRAWATSRAWRPWPGTPPVFWFLVFAGFVRRRSAAPLNRAGPRSASVAGFGRLAGSCNGPVRLSLWQLLSVGGFPSLVWRARVSFQLGARIRVVLVAEWRNEFYAAVHGRWRARSRTWFRPAVLAVSGTFSRRITWTERCRRKFAAPAKESIKKKSPRGTQAPVRHEGLQLLLSERSALLSRLSSLVSTKKYHWLRLDKKNSYNPCGAYRVHRALLFFFFSDA